MFYQSKNDLEKCISTTAKTLQQYNVPFPHALSGHRIPFMLMRTFLASLHICVYRHSQRRGQFACKHSLTPVRSCRSPERTVVGQCRIVDSQRERSHIHYLLLCSVNVSTFVCLFALCDDVRENNRKTPGRCVRIHTIIPRYSRISECRRTVSHNRKTAQSHTHTSQHAASTRRLGCRAMLTVQFAADPCALSVAARSRSGGCCRARQVTRSCGALFRAP